MIIFAPIPHLIDLSVKPEVIPSLQVKMRAGDLVAPGQ